MPHRVEGAAVLLALPEWTRAPGTEPPDWADGRIEAPDFEPSAAKAPPSPILQAEPDPGAKREQAERRLRRGEAPIRVAQEMGLQERAVIDWHNAMVTAATGVPALGGAVADKGGRKSAWN